MKKILKKILSIVIIVCFILSMPLSSQASAQGVGMLLWGIATSISYKLIETGESAYKSFSKERANAKEDQEKQTYKGFNPLTLSKENLEKVAQGISEIEVYGQEKAKEQCLPLVMTNLYNIKNSENADSSKKMQGGNILYMVGPSGVGKTMMAEAIAHAVLKHPEKTLLSINPGDISKKYTLADQLFRTVDIKTIGKNKQDNEDNNGINNLEGEANVLRHILDWGANQL
ncbi:MAG: hypothetical protein RUMPE_00904 [Eubacteriales bacterium SKADARSKE-1]|nr:hypothetical protein [Eubacteriales bacterium SKADARSKE-1]